MELKEAVEYVGKRTVHASVSRDATPWSPPPSATSRGSRGGRRGQASNCERRFANSPTVRASGSSISLHSRGKPTRRGRYLKLCEQVVPWLRTFEKADPVVNSLAAAMVGAKSILRALGEDAP